MINMIGRTTRKESEELFKNWQDDGTVTLIKLSETDQVLREELLSIEKKVQDQLGQQGEAKSNSYKFDLLFALGLYQFLSIENEVTEREASDDDFWRFISMNLIPDIVARRVGGLKASRFYHESRRIWVKTLWWYIYLSWQGTIEDTKSILNHNTTDTIVQLVERPGTGGYRVSFSRVLMRYFGRLAEENPALHSTEMFRKVMRLNTARTRVVEPALVAGGEKDYVKELFEYFNETGRVLQRS